MATSLLRYLLFFLTVGASQTAFAQLPLGSGSPDVECTQMVFDLKQEQFTCQDIVITQGDFTLKAGDARTPSLNFENAIWTFSKNVTINGKNTEVSADQAIVRIANKRLQNVKVVGQPATFEQVLKNSEDAANGRANTINYDLALDVVTLSENAFLSQGDDQITGENITYDVQQQRVVADSNGESTDRVRLLITPSKDEEQDEP